MDAIRLLDIFFASLGLTFGMPLLFILACIGWLDTGSPLFRQIRVGRNQRPFTLIKFRTMHIGTAEVATHLVSAAAITPFGRFLRRTKMDELPQLWNVLKGEMSLVGPRPCLPAQHELIAAREALGVFAVRPGITGFAQVQGIDMSIPEKLAQIDAEMINAITLQSYFKCIIQTLLGAGRGDRIKT